ncbi:MAG: exosortase H [FCB group bacterium]|nr:exosortase H [FCB group bacterium]
MTDSKMPLPSPDKGPGAKKSSAFQSRWPLIKVYLLFILTILVLFTLIMVKPVYFKVVVPFNNFLAWSSGAVLGLLGTDNISVSGTQVVAPGMGLNIAEGCNGIYALSIIIAGVMAFPARIKQKLIGLALAIAVIMILNYIRILTLWYFGIYSDFLFNTMHLYVWEFVIIALGAGVWYYWYDKFVKTD